MGIKERKERKKKITPNHPWSPMTMRKESVNLGRGGPA
jgi:hypothetical protein